MRKIRLPLAILEQSFGRFGGAERLVLSHYLQLKRMNVDVELFYRGPIPDDWTLRLSGHTIQPVPSGFPGNPRECRAILVFLKELSRFDKIIIHHHLEPFLMFYVTKLFGRKTIWYSGSALEFAWEKFLTGMDYRSVSPTVIRTGREFYGEAFTSIVLSDLIFDQSVRGARVIDIESVRRCYKVIANSRFLSKFLARAYRLRKLPHVVYPGTDPILEELSSQYVGADDNYALVVGPLVPRKNLDRVIAAAAITPYASIVAVGNGQARKSLVDLAERQNVPLRIESTVSAKRLAELYSRCSFLANMSLFETFGLTVLEAGLFGKPCLVPNRGGPTEIVVDGETGYLVNPRDLNCLSEKMKHLIENPALRHEMGKRARQRVLKHFTIERSTRNLLKEIGA